MRPLVSAWRTLCVATILAVLAATGCRSTTAAPGTVDRKNPETVAKAYIAALMAHNVDAASEFVIPAAREAFRKAEGFPAPLPPDYEVIVTLEQDRRHGWANVRDTKMLVRLEEREGTWWVVNKR